MYMTKPGMKTRKKAAFRVYDDMPAASCQFLIIPPHHLWLSGFSSPPGLPFSHATWDGIKDPVPQTFRRFIGSRCVSCNICRTCGLLESFSAKKQCVKNLNFRLHVKKWWWLSPPPLKVVVTCHHRHIQSCAFADDFLSDVSFQNNNSLNFLLITKTTDWTEHGVGETNQHDASSSLY